jgi:hypothetical protein
MSELILPDWVGPLLLGAVIAAISYVAKLIIELLRDWYQAVRQAKEARLTQLVRLRSLLREAKMSFKAQNEKAKMLLNMVQANHQNAFQLKSGYEYIFSTIYPDFTTDERELHEIIRSYTVYALRPTNQLLTEWLNNDTFFKAQYMKKSILGDFAKNLLDLDTHLLMWNAKYDGWIPNKPEHALIYLADEERYGPGFPHDIDDLVDKILEKGIF